MDAELKSLWNMKSLQTDGFDELIVTSSGRVIPSPTLTNKEDKNISFQDTLSPFCTTTLLELWEYDTCILAVTSLIVRLMVLAVDSDLTVIAQDPLLSPLTIAFPS